MLSFTGGLKVFVAVEACDMRKGFNGLAALVSERLSEEVRGGALYVFSNPDIDITPLKSADCQLFWALAYGTRTDPKLLAAVRDILHQLQDWGG